MKGAIQFSDALIKGSENIDSEVEKMAKESGKPFLDYQGEEEDQYVPAFNDFYDKILES